MQRATPGFGVSVQGVSIKRILVGVDFSETSEKALDHAVAIARRYGAKIYLAHVISSVGFHLAPYESCVLASKLALQDLKRLEARLVRKGVLAGLEHDVFVSIGDLWTEIKRLTSTEKLDLIVVGTHGRTGFSRVVMGSAAEAVFRHASRPVLTVGPCVPSGPMTVAARRRILYATDFSHESAQALPWALSLAQEHGAELTLLHVVEALDGKTQHDMARVATALEQRLRALVPSGFSSKVACKAEVEFGPIAEGVIQVANTQSSDLIVMGLKPRAAFANHLPWLHAYRIVSEACCPVLTVRSADVG